MGDAVLRLLRLLAIGVGLATVVVRCSPPRDGIEPHLQVRLDGAGLVHVRGQAPVDLADPDHRLLLGEVLAPLSARARWQPALPVTSNPPLLPTTPLRIRLAPGASAGQLLQVLERANLSDIGFYRFELIEERVDGTTGVQHPVLLPKELPLHHHPSESPALGLAVFQSSSGELRYALNRAAGHEEVPEQLFESSDAAALLARLDALPGDDRLEALRFMNVARELPAAALLHLLARLPHDPYSDAGPYLEPIAHFTCCWPPPRASERQERFEAYLRTEESLVFPDLLATADLGEHLHALDLEQDRHRSSTRMHDTRSGRGLVIQWMHETSSIFDAPDGGSRTHLTLVLPGDSDLDGTWAVDGDAVRALFSTGSKLDERNRWFGEATSGTVRLRRHGDRVLVQARLEVPTRRTRSRSNELIPWEPVARTWTFQVRAPY